MDNKSIITAMVVLQKSNGWVYLKGEIEQTIKQIEQELFTISDNEKKYTSHDLNRLIRQNLLDILSTPEKIIWLHADATTELA